MNAKWHAVYCKSRQERRAHEHLLNQEYRSFLPMVRTRRRIRGRDHSRVEPMFPRYLFVQLTDFLEDWSPIRSTRGVIGLVRLGDEVPVVPDELIVELTVRQNGSDAIDLTACQRLEPNDPVEISAGPLAGYQGIYCATTGDRRAVVLLELLNRQQRIQLPTQDIVKC